jgi:hypothetical protein
VYALQACTIYAGTSIKLNHVVIDAVDCDADSNSQAAAGIQEG